MTDFDKKINSIIMQELGLEVGPSQRIYDQDTGDILQINGTEIVAPGTPINNSIKCGQPMMTEFDPYNNRKMMNQLFAYFLDKISDETDQDVVTYYNIDGSSPNTGRVQCKMSDNSTITSGEYKRDSLKYTDIIIQLNGGNADDLDLKDFDTPMTQESIKNVKGGNNIGRPKKI